MRLFPVLFLSLMLGFPLAGKELLIGVENINYYPISAMRHGQYAGFSRDVLDAFAERYGHNIIYKAYPVKSLFGAYLAGQVDFKFPDNSGWAQESKHKRIITYSQAVLESIDGVMVYPHAQGRGLGALKRLGTIVGFTRFAYLDAIAAGKVKRHEHESLDGLMKLVKSNYVDGVYSNIFVTRYFLKNSSYGSQYIVFDKTLPYEMTGYALSSFKSPERLKPILLNI
ncbi:substrate-binding periplasmic protein [Thalassomonas actiniarum]|uniref:Transporter substrate-binding domain-containing protein n=1 Tax=Thalassomonas actiniarum TaxID=485447 RepID=A0AAE9YT17_9GAMM|nr:transporter substrate-binding domain-containing protein [Thalassomonas actiniarum]WDD99783.1 transporter substrate-binding domain-containing protein [Thalassomonas actiniarum]